MPALSFSKSGSSGGARRVRRSILAATAVGIGVLAIASAVAAPRTLPPDPSRTPWVSDASVQALTAAIANQRRIVAAGGWPKVQGKSTLRLGDVDPAVDALRQRLIISGDLSPRAQGGQSFDDNIDQAVRRYQTRNGLEPTGIVYGITLRSLNVPAESRLAQLETNLARHTALASVVAKQPRYILMNSASFELQGIANGTVEIASRVISGKRATPTPDVSTSVQNVNLLPYWHVPGTIAKAQLVPEIRKDPTYLYKQNIRVFSSFGGAEVDPATVNWWGPEADRYVFRQEPGPGNALGLMRFDMPNKHIVYMHDTPMKQLFGMFERAYSAGCVRVQNFYNLAQWVLAGQDGWTASRLEAATLGGQRATIKLKQPVPVHFIYLTAWVENGVVQFRNDLYNRDEQSAGVADSGESKVLIQSLAP